jgi:hypothetical protein
MMSDIDKELDDLVKSFQHNKQLLEMILEKVRDSKNPPEMFYGNRHLADYLSGRKKNVDHLQWTH